MNIEILDGEIEKTGKTKFDENVVIFKEECDRFREFDGFIREYGNSFGTRMRLMEMQYITDPDWDGNKNDFLILKICGGKNGCGYWTEYFSDIRTLFQAFSNKYMKVWLVDIDNDCPDDVFYMTMCVR